MRCSDCVHPSAEGYEQSELYFVEQIANGAYAHRCRNGHWMVQILNNPTHEILFESGAVALLFGFHREALTSFHVALERFYMFATKILAHHLGADDEHVLFALNKQINRSEREFGAFAFTYLLALKRPFKLPEDKDYERRRNKVVHAGSIPSYDDALRHGQTVYTTVRTLSEELMTVAPKSAEQAFKWDGSRGAREAIEQRTKLEYSGGSVNTRMILSDWKFFRSALPIPGPPDLGPAPSMDLGEAIDDLRRRFTMYGGIPVMDLGQPPPA